MALLEKIITEAAVYKLGWSLVHFIWQAAAVVLLLEIILLLLRKVSASLRYIVAYSTFVLIALLPVVTMQFISVPAAAPETLIEPIIQTPAPVTVTTAQRVIIDTPLPGNAAPAESIVTQTTVNWKQKAVTLLEPALPKIVTIWLLGVFALSLWHLGGWTQLQRLRTKMTRPVDASLKVKMEELAQKLGLKQAVHLCESMLVQIPTVVGWIKPVILLPAGALSGLTTEQLEAILAHELAHIKRFDYLVNILQTTVEILGFYHPAVWWVSHRIRFERENCCDDWAVGISGDKVRYAKALALLEELRAGDGKLAVAAAGGNLFNRIRRLIGKDSTERTFSWVPTITVILLLVAMIVSTTLALTTNEKNPTAEFITNKPENGQTENESSNAEKIDSSTKVLIETQIIHVNDEFLEQVKLDSDSLKNSNSWTQYQVDDSGNPIMFVIDSQRKEMLLKIIDASEHSSSISRIFLMAMSGQEAMIENYSGYDFKSQELGRFIKIKPELSQDGQGTYLDCELLIRKFKNYDLFSDVCINKKVDQNDVPESEIFEYQVNAENALLRDDHTLLILGGKLVSFRDVENRKPILRHIPVTGEFEEQKNEIILIKTTIVRPEQNDDIDSRASSYNMAKIVDYNAKELMRIHLDLDLEAGQYVEIKDNGEREFPLKQVTTDSIGKTVKDFPAYASHIYFEIRSNFDLNLSTQRFTRGSFFEHDKWDAYITSPDTITGDGYFTQSTLCVNTWKFEPWKIPPLDTADDIITSLVAVKIKPDNKQQKSSVEVQKVDPNSWQEKFNEVYSLRDDEVLKRIAPPFIPERRNYYLNEPRLNPSPDRYKSAEQYTFSWNGRLKISGNLSGSGITSLDSILYSVLRLGNFEYEIPDELVYIDLTGDWIVRKDTPQEKLLGVLEQIILKDTEREIKFVKRQVQENAIIVSGQYRFKRLPNIKDGDYILLSINKTDTYISGGGGSGTISSFLHLLGNRTKTYVIDKTDPAGDVKLYWRYHHSASLSGLWDLEKRRNEKVDELLENLSFQTGLTFERKNIPVEKWFVAEEGVILTSEQTGTQSENKKPSQVQELKSYELPARWSLKYIEGSRGDTGNNLSILKVVPKPANRYDESWKQEKFEFRIFTLNGEELETINLRQDSHRQQTDLKPGKYFLIYERERGENPDNFKTRCGKLLVDLSRSGIYELEFTPKLGTAAITGTLGGCYSINFEKAGEGPLIRGFAYQHPNKQYLLDGLPAGQYRLSAVTQDKTGNVFVSPREVTLKEKEKATVNTKLPPTGSCSLKGNIFGKQRKYKTPWSDVWPESEGKWYILLRPQGSGNVRSAEAYEALTMDSIYVVRAPNIVQETPDKAQYKIEDIVPGKYTVTAIEHPSWVGCTITRQQSKTLILRDGEQAVLDFDLTDTPVNQQTDNSAENKNEFIESDKVVIQLLDSNSQPVADAWMGTFVDFSDIAENPPVWFLSDGSSYKSPGTEADAKIISGEEGKITLGLEDLFKSEWPPDRKVSVFVIDEGHSHAGIREVSRDDIGSQITLTLQPACRVRGRFDASTYRKRGFSGEMLTLYTFRKTHRICQYSSRQRQFEIILPPGRYEFMIYSDDPFKAVRLPIEIKPGQKELDISGYLDDESKFSSSSSNSPNRNKAEEPSEQVYVITEGDYPTEHGKASIFMEMQLLSVSEQLLKKIETDTNSINNNPIIDDRQAQNIIQTVQTDENSKILARPQMVAFEGKQAIIKLGDKDSYTLSSPGEQSIQKGILIRFKPEITNNKNDILLDCELLILHVKDVNSINDPESSAPETETIRNKILKPIPDRQTLLIDGGVSPFASGQNHNKRLLMLIKSSILSQTNMTSDKSGQTLTPEQQRIISMERLKRLGIALNVYADENNNKLPNNLKQLKPYFANSDVYYWLLDNIEYEGKITQRITSQAYKIPLAFGPARPDDANNINVLFMDAHVETVTLEKVKDLFGIHEPTESFKKLAALGKAMVFYENDKQSALPDTLQEFVPYLRNKEDIEWLTKNVEYLGKGKTRTDNPDTVIAYNKSLLKQGKGADVLFLDAHVEFVSTEEIEKLCIKSIFEKADDPAAAMLEHIKAFNKEIAYIFRRRQLKAFVTVDDLKKGLIFQVEMGPEASSKDILIMSIDDKDLVVITGTQASSNIISNVLNGFDMLYEKPEPGDCIVVKIINIKYADCNRLTEKLRSQLKDITKLQIIPDENTKSLIINTNSYDLKRIENLIAKLDTPNAQMPPEQTTQSGKVTKLFKLNKYTSPIWVVQSLKIILAYEAGSSETPRPEDTSTVDIKPVDGNCLIVTAAKAQIPKITQLVQAFDVEIQNKQTQGSNNSIMNIFRLKYADGNKLAELMRLLFMNSHDATIMTNARASTLLVRANKSDTRIIEKLVAILDTDPEAEVPQQELTEPPAGQEPVIPENFEEILRRVESEQILSEIGKSMLLYGGDHEDKYPDSLEQLKNYIKEEEFEWAIQNVGYLGSDKIMADPPDVPIAYDKTLLAGQNATNVFFNDAHVEFAEAERLKELYIIKEQIQIEARYLYVCEEFYKKLGLLDTNSISESDFWPEPPPFIFQTPAQVDAVGMTLNKQEVDFLLKAAAADENSKILTAPRGTFLDSELATFTINRKLSFISGFNEPKFFFGKPTPVINNVQVGATVEVTPHVRFEQEDILMKLKFEYSWVPSVHESTYKNKYKHQSPQFSRRTSQFQFALPAGKTLVYNTGLRTFYEEEKKLSELENPLDYRLCPKRKALLILLTPTLQSLRMIEAK